MGSPQLLDFQVTRVFNPDLAPWLLRTDPILQQQWATVGHTHQASEIIGLSTIVGPTGATGATGAAAVFGNMDGGDADDVYGGTSPIEGGTA